MVARLQSIALVGACRRCCGRMVKQAKKTKEKKQKKKKNLFYFILLVTQIKQNKLKKK
jgi:hypothetical protein